MENFADVLIAAFIVLGGVFGLVGSFGLVKLRDTMQRLHGPTKATTLGIGCVLIASMLYFATHKGHLSFHELLITLFLFITAPVSAHLLAKTGLHLQLKHTQKTQGKPIELRSEEVGDKPVPHPDKGHG